MPTLGRYNFTLPSVSSLVIYGQACAILAYSIRKPVLAFWGGTRLEGDRTLFGLVEQYIYKPASFSGLFFRVAYSESVFEKRLIVFSQLFASFTVWILTTWFVAEKNRANVEEYEKHQYQARMICYLLLGFSVVIVATVELEEWWKRIRKRAEEKKYSNVQGAPNGGRQYQHLYPLNARTAGTLPANNAAADTDKMRTAVRESAMVENVGTEGPIDTEIVSEQNNSRLGAYGISQGKQKAE